MKKKFLSIAAIFAMVSAITMQVAFADPTTTATLSGTPSVSGSGDWAGTIGMTGTVSATAASTGLWSALGYAGGTDYITFVDNGSTDGAYMQIKVSNANYTYSGAGTGNTGLVHATATYLMANAAAVPTYGKDDTSKNANLITAQTCDTEELPSTNLLFHTSLRSQAPYAMFLTTSPKTLLRILSTSECTATVKVSLDTVGVQYPALTTGGTYTNTIVVTATDGTP